MDIIYLIALAALFATTIFLVKLFEKDNVKSFMKKEKDL